jgi:hypothetical protein
MYARHHRSGRCAGDFGDLVDAQTLDVGAIQRGAQLLGKLAHRRLDIVVADQVEHFVLGRSQPAGGVLGLGHQLSVGELVGQPLSRAPLLFSVRADVAVEQYPVQPAAQIGAVAEPMETGECLRRRLLQQVLRIGVIVGQLQRVAVELVNQWKSVPLEAGGEQRIVFRHAWDFSAQARRCLHGWHPSQVPKTQTLTTG